MVSELAGHHGMAADRPRPFTALDQSARDAYDDWEYDIYPAAVGLAVAAVGIVGMSILLTVLLL
jgi:hypothetical protein